MSSHRLPPRVGQRPKQPSPTRRPARRKSNGPQIALLLVGLAVGIVVFVVVGKVVSTSVRRSYEGAQAAAKKQALLGGQRGIAITEDAHVPGLTDQTLPDGWRRIEFPLLAVDLPAVPDFVSTLTRFLGDEVEFNRWVAKDEARRLSASAGWIHTSGSQSEDFAEAHDLIRRGGGTVVSEKDVSRDDLAGFETAFDRGELKTVIWVFALPHKACYLVELTGPNVVPGSPEADRIFNSIRLPSLEGWRAVAGADPSTLKGPPVRGLPKETAKADPGSAEAAGAQSEAPSGSGTPASGVGDYAGPHTVPPTNRPVDASTPLPPA